MSWQDREYARGHTPVRPVWASPASLGGGRSIVATLILINVAVYVLGRLFPAFGVWLSGSAQSTPFGLQIRLGVAELQADRVLHGEIWRLVTAQYLHAGLGHIFINMLVLYFLGRPLERIWSARKFFTIYTLCGICGNLFFTFLAAQGVIPKWMPAVGASGCIYGLLGIVAVMFPHATVYVYFLFPIKIRTAAIIFGGIALLTVLSRGQNYGGEACHLAGLAFGVWWAWKGDRWWSSSARFGAQRIGSVFRRTGGEPRPPRKARFTMRVAQRRKDEETIDRILKKVYEGGIHSLTESEKRSLREATERQRQRDHDAGRVDRL